MKSSDNNGKRELQTAVTIPAAAAAATQFIFDQ